MEGHLATSHDPSWEEMGRKCCGNDPSQGVAGRELSSWEEYTYPTPLSGWELNYLGRLEKKKKITNSKYYTIWIEHVYNI